MAKKNEVTDKMVPTDPNAPSNVELVPFADLIKSLTKGQDVTAEIIIAGGDGVYWPPQKGSVCHGVIQNRYEIDSRYGKAAFYNVTLATECDAANRDGELFVAKPGESIMVLERAILRHLREYVGQEVVIQCQGKTQTKAGQDLYMFEAAVIKDRKPAGTSAAV